MSSRGGGGGGRGRGNRGGGAGGRGGYQQFPGRGGGDGRGQQQSQYSGGRGGRTGGGGSSVYNAPPESSQVSFPQLPSSSTPPLSVSATTSEFQQKLNIHAGSTSAQASSSSAAPAPQTVNVPATAAPGVPVPPPASSKNDKVAVRPGYGISGRRCTVKANHFLVKYGDVDLHQYDVSITPEVLSKKVCREILTDLIDKYKQSHLGGRAIAYDGRKSVYTAGAMPFESKDFVIKLFDKDGPKREREFKVSIRFAAKADVHHLSRFLQGRQLDIPQETIQALDIVLRQQPSKTYVTVGRSFFCARLGDIGELGQGLEYWKGFYQSLRPTQMGLSLNIDISARPFYESILVTDFVTKYLSLRALNRPLSDQDRLKVKRTLRGVKVEVTYQKFARHYKICGLSNQPLNQLSFPDDTGKNISVVNYFYQKYNIRIQHGSLPALQAGTDAKPTYLPMEVCKIVSGQRYTKKLNERQVAALLKATCRRPSDREKDIKKMVTVNDYNKEDLVQKGFGMHVSYELTSIDARVLQPPMLRYHASGMESRVDPKVGQWNMINKKMINGGRVDAWTCVNFSRAVPDTVRMFCKQLIDMCCSKGMVFNPQPVLPIQSFPPNQIEKALVQLHSQCAGRQLQLLIVILPDTSGFYGTIKRVCETQLGIVSQCCQPRHTTRISPQYLENVALKINVKVGGRNLVLEQAIQRKMTFVTDIPTIIFGADVTHPQPGEDAGPSIAAVVASMDWPEVTMYRGLVSAQGHRQEIIQDLYTATETSGNVTEHGGMIREHLKAFRASTRGLKPGRIIFYRDGVSEGQFSQVLWEEVTAIRKACFSLEENYAPRITFIVVQKRHHTRLFPGIHNDRHTTDKSGNILPGTVVDTTICHPSEFDFYLCSHAGIQGTSRPAHYRVLLDENNFTADQLQGLTNNLCYTYARCTRSVSVVPPAYYAHLAAFRARYYIEGRASDGGSSGVDGRAEGEQAVPVQVHALPEVKENVKAVMFYC